MNLHIIYTETSVVLSMKEYENWQDVQRDYPDYKASLGPWPEAEVAEFLNDEYSDIFPSACIQIAELRDSGCLSSIVRFTT
jgi:hypothetical protein